MHQVEMLVVVKPRIMRVTYVMWGRNGTAWYGRIKNIERQPVFLLQMEALACLLEYLL